MTSRAFSGVVPGPVLHVNDHDGPDYPFVPAVGEHTAAVLAELGGLGADEIANLVAEGVING